MLVPFLTLNDEFDDFIDGETDIEHELDDETARVCDADWPDTEAPVVRERMRLATFCAPRETAATTMVVIWTED